MTWSRLHGEQYVRLGPGAAEAVAPYVGVPSSQIDELLLDLPVWPAEIWPAPVPGWDGRLIAGDPLLRDATGDGLVFSVDRSPDDTILVPWEQVRRIEVVGRLEHRAGA